MADGQGIAGQGLAGQGLAGQGLGGQGGVLARKLARARGADFDQGLASGFAPDLGADLGLPAGGDGGENAAFSAPPAADPHLRAWRLALARAARDQLKMTVGFNAITQRQASLTEVLETPMQRALILMLQGRGEGMGIMILSGQMLAAMIEMLTLTQLSPDAPDAADLRKPTRTDAAMAVEFVDAALSGLETVLAEGNVQGGALQSGLACLMDWSAGYRYAAFIDDPRPLHLMLEDGDYQLFAADLALEDGTRTGTITLALPMQAAALGIPELSDFAPMDLPPAPLAPDDFTDDLAAQVMDLPAQVDAALAQISLPLERVMRLQLGEVLALPAASLDQITLLGMDGRRIAGARLGQNRGMRALRLTDVAQPRASAPNLTSGSNGGLTSGLNSAGTSALGQGSAAAHLLPQNDLAFAGAGLAAQDGQNAQFAAAMPFDAPEAQPVPDAAFPDLDFPNAIAQSA